NSLVRRRQMLPRAIGDDSLGFLCNAVLFMGVKIPPGIFNPFVHAGLVFFESLRFQRYRSSRLPLFVWIKIDPISCRFEIVRGHAKSNDLSWVFAHPGRRVTHMRWKNEV